MKTIFTKTGDVAQKWHVIDADGLVVGRLASQVAKILTGKDKPVYTPNSDTGDFVVIVNAEKVHFTGNKMQDKAYYHHTGYAGGIRKVVAKDLIREKPEKVLYTAIRGMMPKNRLGKKQLTKLKVYSGPDHPHAAQNPEILNINLQ